MNTIIIPGRVPIIIPGPVHHGRFSGTPVDTTIGKIFVFFILLSILLTIIGAGTTISNFAFTKTGQKFLDFCFISSIISGVISILVVMIAIIMG